MVECNTDHLLQALWPSSHGNSTNSNSSPGSKTTFVDIVKKRGAFMDFVGTTGGGQGRKGTADIDGGDQRVPIVVPTATQAQVATGRDTASADNPAATSTGGDRDGATWITDQ